MPGHVVVLGGGITGLSAAFHLSRRLPKTRITLLEKSRRLGGWIQTERVNVKDEQGREASVALEGGPRTLRPNSPALAELVNLLGLKSQLIITPKTAPAAKNRFLYIPGDDNLTPLPSSLSTLFNTPVWPQLLSGILAELFKKANRPQDAEDESFGAFLARRFSPEFERLFGSALVHGIYATDARKLSIRAAFPTVWAAEERGKGSLVRGMLRKAPPAPPPDVPYEVGDVDDALRDAAVYSFMEGMETLPQALHAALKASPNVTVQTDVGVKGLEPPDATGNITVTTQSGESISADNVVSALPLPALFQLTSNTTTPLPHLLANPTSSVTVANLIFPPTPEPLYPDGFGYLIPRPATDYPDGRTAQSAPNPGVLGTVFDSATLHAQDRGAPGFTKLTMMVGGPYMPAPFVTPPQLVELLQSHLGLAKRQVPPPVHVALREQRDCIPTPTVGHVQRMHELRGVLRDPGGEWRGRLEVIGAGVGGVSVGGCVEAGRNAGRWWTN